MTQLYMRTCEFTVSDRVLSSPPMTLEFESEFSVFAPTQTKAKIYNPAPETVAACEKKGKNFPSMIITAGHRDDFGTCVTGEIVKFVHKKGHDSVLEMQVSDRTSLWSYSKVNKSWAGSISARDAADQILKDVGVTIAEMKFEEEKVYEGGLSFSGVTLRSAMDRIARDTKSRFSFRNGQASFLSTDATTVQAAVLNYNSGLLESAKTYRGYKLKTLFMYKINGGSIVLLEKDTTTGKVQEKMKVIKGKHVFGTDKAHTEFEAVRI